MNTIIIHYSPGSYEYNPELLLINEDAEKFKFGVDSQLRCIPGEDQFGVQFDILILTDSKVFLKAGMLFAFVAEGFGELIKSDPALKDHRQDLEDICKQAWCAATGAVAAMTVLRPDDYPAIDPKAPVRSGFILPPVSFESLASDIKIIVK